jgi:hypothetical protein
LTKMVWGKLSRLDAKGWGSLRGEKGGGLDEIRVSTMHTQS